MTVIFGINNRKGILLFSDLFCFIEQEDGTFVAYYDVKINPHPNGKFAYVITGEYFVEAELSLRRKLFSDMDDYSYFVRNQLKKGKIEAIKDVRLSSDISIVLGVGGPSIGLYQVDFRGNVTDVPNYWGDGLGYRDASRILRGSKLRQNSSLESAVQIGFKALRHSVSIGGNDSQGEDAIILTRGGINNYEYLRKRYSI